MFDLVGDGYVGEVLSTSIVGSGVGSGGEVAPADAYTMDQTKGAFGRLSRTCNLIAQLLTRMAQRIYRHAVKNPI